MHVPRTTSMFTSKTRITVAISGFKQKLLAQSEDRAQFAPLGKRSVDDVQVCITLSASTRVAKQRLPSQHIFLEGSQISPSVLHPYASLIVCLARKVFFLRVGVARDAVIAASPPARLRSGEATVQTMGHHENGNENGNDVSFYGDRNVALVTENLLMLRRAR